MPRRRRLLLVGVVAAFLALPGRGEPAAPADAPRAGGVGHPAPASGR
jgi:hypothetical protein